MLKLRQDRAPSILFQKNSKETLDTKQDDKNPITSRSSKYIRLNRCEINNLNKEMKKSFTTLENRIDETENEDSDLTSSDSEDSDGDYNF